MGYDHANSCRAIACVAVLAPGELFLRTRMCLCKCFYIGEKSRLFMSMT